MDLLLESGVVDQRIPFYTGFSGLASGSTVYRQRGTNAAAAMTTPDIVEDATVAGLYRLLLDEDTTITTGQSSEAMTIVIAHASLGNPIVLKVVLYDALKTNVKQMNSAPVTGTGTSGDKWRGVQPVFEEASFDSEAFSILAFEFGAGHISPSYDSAAFDTEAFSVLAWDLEEAIPPFITGVRYVRTTRKGRSFQCHGQRSVHVRGVDARH